jgi:hypothetical protein
MELQDRLCRIIDNYEILSVFTIFLIVLLIVIIGYLYMLYQRQLKEDAIRRDILRKHIGCSAEDFYKDLTN